MTPSPTLTTTRPSNPDDLNAECIKALQALKVGDGGFVAVVGAGPSSPMIPRGDDLIEEMKKACGLDVDYRYFWDLYEAAKATNRIAYCELIKTKFSSSPYWSNDVYEVVCQIPFKTIITTNYDQYLPKAFGKVEGAGWNNRFCVYPPRKYPEKNGTGMVYATDFDVQKYLVAVHGYKDPENEEWPLDSIILAKSDYTKHYFGSGVLTLCGWWKEVLTRHNCVFIGSSLEEPGIAKALSDLVTGGAFERQPRQHVQLINVSLSETIMNGIKQAPEYPNPVNLYNSVKQIQFDPKNLFEGLLEVLSEIAGIPVCNDLEPRLAAPTFPDFDNLNFSPVAR